MPTTRPAEPILALDIGGVCLGLRHDEACSRFGVASFADFRERFAEVWQLAYDMETGDVPEAEFMARAAELLGMSSEELHGFWLGLIGEEMPGAGDFVRTAIGLGCRPVFLSDVSPIHYRALLPRLSFAEEMHGAVVSYEVGALKPGTAMYVAMEERFCGGGVPLLYVDDRENNVLAARERGWAAYQFGNFTEATARLRQRLEEV
jgi:putative hydrolase of the HAD superfamily